MNETGIENRTERERFRNEYGMKKEQKWNGNRNGTGTEMEREPKWNGKENGTGKKNERERSDQERERYGRERERNGNEIFKKLKQLRNLYLYQIQRVNDYQDMCINYEKISSFKLFIKYCFGLQFHLKINNLF